MSNASIEIGGIRIGSQTNPETQSIHQTQRNRETNRETKNNFPFHALIIGNFSGSHASSSVLKPKIIDRDNFDDTLSAISPTLSIRPALPTGSQADAINLVFNELEDFEPDHLFKSLDIFSELRTLRRRLANNATFEAAAKEMNAWQTDAPATATSPTPENIAEPLYKASSNEGLLDSLLTETAYRQDKEIADAPSKLAQTLIQQVVAPYVIPGTHPKKNELLASVDNSITGLMNSLLHDPDFQLLEASWRSLYSSVKKIKTHSKLKLYIADIDKNTLDADSNSQDLTTSKAYKNLIEPFTDIAGSIPWSVIVGDFYFGDNAQDLFLLERLGLLAQHCNATFIAAASAELVGCQNISTEQDADSWTHSRANQYTQAWDVLRESPQAKNIALTFPRTLARLPYGEKTKSIEEFAFEEMQGSEHNNYLWGNGAYAILILLAQAFELNQWQFVPGENNEISNLPSHTYEQDGDTELKPCAEIYLTEKGGEKVLENGLLPIWSILRSDSIRVGPFASLHSSNQRISGRWES